MKKLPYGVTQTHGYTFLKLRYKLSEDSLKDLNVDWGHSPSLTFTTTRKGYTLVEGVLPNDSYNEFIWFLRIAAIETKMAALREQRDQMVSILESRLTSAENAALNPE